MTPLELTLRLVAGALLVPANAFLAAIGFALTRARQFTRMGVIESRANPRTRLRSPPGGRPDRPYIESGAATPSTASALATVWRAAATRASRASRTASSSAPSTGHSR